MNLQLLDTLPVAGVVIGFVIVALLAYELAFRVGRWWQNRTPDVEEEGPGGVLVGSLLALMAFLLAVTMGMAADRFDTRRGLVLAEANAIGTTYLRAGYLPSPAGEETRQLLSEYVPLRITTVDADQLAANIERSVEIQDDLWTIAEEIARTSPSDVVALYIESLNETIDLHQSRITAGIYARVPETILWLLIAGAVLALALVGYNAGLTRRHSLISAVVLVIALGAVLALVVDLDRPQGGLLRVSQQPLIDLQQQIGPP
jgi:hypothetical protein